MKPENEIKPIRLVHEPKDRAAISAALARLEDNAAAQKRNLAIIAPEVDAIRRDSSDYYCSPDRVLEEHMRNPENHRSQLTIALRALLELQRQVIAIVPVIVADVEAMEVNITRTTADLVNMARTKTEMHLQAWFTPANLPYALSRATPVLNAINLAQRYQPASWAFSMTNTANDAGLADGRNRAAEIIRHYRSLLNTLSNAKEGVEQVAREIESL